MSLVIPALTESQRYWDVQGQQFRASPRTYLASQLAELHRTGVATFFSKRWTLAVRANTENVGVMVNRAGTFFQGFPSPSKVFFCFPPATTYKTTEIVLGCAAGVSGIAAVFSMFAISSPLISIVLSLSFFGNLLGSGTAKEAFDQQSLADINEQLRRNNEAAARQNTFYAAENTAHAANNARLTAEVAALTRERNAFRVQNEALRVNNAELHANIGRLSAEIANLNERLATLGRENATFQASNTELRATIDGLTAQIAGLEQQLGFLRNENTRLETNIARLEARIADLERELEAFRTENAALRANVQELNTQNASLRGNIENLTSQISLLSVERISLESLVARFQTQLDLFRTGTDADRATLLETLGQFTQQLSAYQDLWRRISHENGAFRDTFTAQLARLQTLVDALTNPTRIREEAEMRDRAIEDVARRRQQLVALDAQIAQINRLLQERDTLLKELREAHSRILANLGRHDATLEAQVAQLGEILQRTVPTTVEVIVKHTTSDGNALGVRHAPNWQDTTLFVSTTPGEWRGRIPLGIEFKFVATSANGAIAWEQGSNHKVGDPRHPEAGIEAFTIRI